MQDQRLVLGRLTRQAVVWGQVQQHQACSMHHCHLLPLLLLVAAAYQLLMLTQMKHCLMQTLQGP